MDDFGHGQDRDELSLASIHRLRSLLQVIKAAVDQPGGPWSERAFAIEQAKKGWCNRERSLHGLLPVVGRQYEGVARALVASIEDALQVLARRLGQEWQRRQSGEWGVGHDRPDGQVWSLGSTFYRLEQRPILRGKVELCRKEPIALDIPEDVVQYLMAVPGTRDQLTRETHGHWGYHYHYHYLDGRDRRSDTLLTFDRESSCTAKPTLCWERHAEGQKFKARAGMWGTDKRESVYSVCLPDAERFTLAHFKRPASDAEVVWPLAS